MFQSSSRAYARASYTVDLRGLFAHAYDVGISHLRTAATVLSAGRPRSRVGPALRHHSEHQVPDSVRLR